MFGPSFFTTIINSYLPEPQSSLLNGIIFGESLKTSKDFYQQLKQVGLLHIVVLSGINITILAATISSVTGFLDKRISILLTIVSIIIFIIFVGPDPPVVRAGIMGILTLFAMSTGRTAVSLYLLLMSFLLILIFVPEWIATVSFQLSYGATLGIILFGSTPSKNTIMRELKPSLAAQAFTAPIIFIYFKQLSLIAPLSNILTSFIIPPLMIFGFLTAILGKINFYLGIGPATVCYVLLTYLVWIITTLSRVPFSFFTF